MGYIILLFFVPSHLAQFLSHYRQLMHVEIISEKSLIYIALINNLGSLKESLKMDERSEAGYDSSS